jgi:hypothetical protein
MEISEENLEKKKNVERFQKAHHESSGLEDQKYKKPGSLPPSQNNGQGENVSSEKGNPPPAENCLLEQQSKVGWQPKPPVRTQPGALSPPRADRGGRTPQILWVTLLKTRQLGKIQNETSRFSPSSHHSPEPAAIPLQPLRVWRKGRGIVGGESACPARHAHLVSSEGGEQGASEPPLLLNGDTRRPHQLPPPPLHRRTIGIWMMERSLMTCPACNNTWHTSATACSYGQYHRHW